MLPMKGKELEKWSEVRKQGALKYSIKNSLIAFFLVFTINVVGNGINHIDKLDKYIAYNLHIWPRILLTSVMSIAILMLCSWFLWKFNEKRYKSSNQ